MQQQSSWKVAAAALAAAGVLIGIGLSPSPAPAQALSGFDVFRSNCGGCHELPDPEDPKRTRQAWDVILTRMVKERGATLSKQEYAAVLSYLDSFNREKRDIKWVDTPAQSHATQLKAADAGKLPTQWVDLTIGAEQEIPWAVQADPQGKVVYLSPLKSAATDQFPVLIDNSGIVQSGTATARLQVLSGKGKLGAGLVFGFRSPQQYYGVRISPRDIVLYEVNGGQRALLARAAVAAPLKQWHTLSVDVADKAVKVSLNGKPVPSLNQTLQSYKGGRVGINTQEDTVALFDQWTVSVK
jgi:hypothetical protein